MNKFISYLLLLIDWTACIKANSWICSAVSSNIAATLIWWTYSWWHTWTSQTISSKSTRNILILRLLSTSNSCCYSFGNQNRTEVGETEWNRTVSCVRGRNLGDCHDCMMRCRLSLRCSYVCPGELESNNKCYVFRSGIWRAGGRSYLIWVF